MILAVRMQAHYPDGSPYNNLRHAFATVFREGMHHPSWTGHPALGGFRALYRGVEATTVRGVVLSFTQICSYDQIKQSLKSRGLMQEGFGLHLTASIFAGCVSMKVSIFCNVSSSFICTDCFAPSLRVPLVRLCSVMFVSLVISRSPPDVVKVRLMNDKHRHIEGVVHCIKNILLHEGPMAFYKGFGMCWGRVSSIIPSSFRY